MVMDVSKLKPPVKNLEADTEMLLTSKEKMMDLKTKRSKRVAKCTFELSYTGDEKI